MADQKQGGDRDQRQQGQGGANDRNPQQKNPSQGGQRTDPNQGNVRQSGSGGGNR